MLGLLGRRKLLGERQEALLGEERTLIERLRAALVSFGSDVLPADLRTLDETLLHLDELFLLVVAGEFNSGKSSFINALLGEEGQSELGGAVSWRSKSETQTQSNNDIDVVFVLYLHPQLDVEAVIKELSSDIFQSSHVPGSDGTIWWEPVVLREARKTGKCLVVYEDNRLFGAGAEIAALIAEEAFDALDAPVMRLGGPEVPAMPYNKAQEDWFMPDPSKIATKMRELAAY